MSKSFRATATRLGLVAAVVVLGAGGTAAGVATASASSRAPAHHVAKPPPAVDHQLCYSALSTHFKVPGGVRLINQFSPAGFVPSISTIATVHCNPVAEKLPTHLYSITNPNAHLACFSIISAPPQPTPTVAVTNEFGTAALVPGQPNFLCVPSWKSLTGPPNKTPTTPPNLNHFTCYPVRVASGAYHPPTVVLQDEFDHVPVAANVTAVPAELCLPTEKIVGTHVFKIINPLMHLLCFPVSRTPIVPRVWDENQFGTAPVSIHATNWLCVPSTKKIV